MTTDDLDERLRSHGDAWRQRDAGAPSLDTMLDVATRRRTRWQPWLAVAAAVLVVAAVAAIPIVRHAQDDNNRPASSPLPSTIIADGTTLTRFGTEAWHFPVLDEQDPKVVWVYAEIQGGPACAFGAVARVQSETQESVTIVVGKYIATPVRSAFACPAIKLPPQRIMVTLQAPFGSRQLIDATTGTPQEVLDPVAFPAPQFVPAGYQAAPLTWDGATSGKYDGVATRAYRDGPDFRLEIKMGPPSVLGRIGAVILDRPTVRGHPATVWQDYNDLTCLSWSETPTQNFRVCSMGSPSAPLDPATLVQVANSMS